MLKSELRRIIREKKGQFTQQQLCELSLPIVDRIRSMLEVDTHALLDELVAEGKTVFLPKVLDDETMELCRYTGRESLREGAFHIMEPITEFFCKDDLTKEPSPCYALIPGLAFDAQGHRLGRGKGYYDRFLTSFKGKTIGVCFDFQKVAEVPVDAHDVAVDRVV